MSSLIRYFSDLSDDDYKNIGLLVATSKSSIPVKVEKKVLLEAVNKAGFNAPVRADVSSIGQQFGKWLVTNKRVVALMKPIQKRDHFFMDKLWAIKVGIFKMKKMQKKTK